MSETILNIVGYSATVSLVLGYLPQAVYTIRTRETDSIAMPTFLLMGLGSVLFIVQGIMLINIPLIIANAITTVCSVIIVAIKIQNNLRKRRGGRG